jgi:predicted RNA-binding Zn-ribbon protein involved in translation (DUF1610 family)
LKIDVVVGKFSGGYLAKPRWSTGKRRKRYVELHYKISIKKEDIPNMTEDEIYSVIKKDLYNNDYEWQRNVMHPYGGKKLAEGIDNILYKCPECGELNSIYASKNEIECRACNTHGHIDKYGFIQGFKFDNLVDWDNYQREAIDEVRDSKFSSTARMVTVDTESQFRTKPQPVSIAYHDGSIFVKGKEVEEFKISEMHNPVLTMRRNLSFDYEGITVMFYVDRLAMSFLRACQSKY